MKFPSHTIPASASLLFALGLSIFLQVWAHHPLCPVSNPRAWDTKEIGTLLALNQKDASEGAHIAALVHRVLLGSMEPLLTQSP